MWGWLKRGTRRSAGSTGPAATLAVFGKHPGWDDHMPDFGVDSETLAELKQNIYVAGIGGQIDSGAWERLESSRRMEGFDHSFLWAHGSNIVLGQLWSSTDRKGRSKYPMVACIQLEKLPLEAILEPAHLILNQVRDACKGTSSADNVVLSCRTAQAQLNEAIARTGAAPGTGAIRFEDTQQFLSTPEFQPDSLGLLRVLHELDNAMGPHLSNGPEAKKATDWQSYHVRVPLAVKSADQGLLLWSRFLRCSLPETVPLLLIVRNSTGWLDVVMGNPTGGGLFCLQASLSALPMATAIPYDIAPSLPARLKTVTACFLGEPLAATEATSASRQTPASISNPQSNTPQLTGKSQRAKGILLGLGVIAFAVLCASFALWMQPSSHASRNAAAEAANLAAANRAKLERQAAELEQRYGLALEQARAAFAQGDYSNALAGAEAALAMKTNDSQAVKLKADIQADQSYRGILKLAQDAYDHGDYAEAVKQADQAAQIKSGDPALVALKEQSVRQIAKREQEAELQRKYSDAVEAGRAALQKHDYAQAISQAEKALVLKSSGSEATQIKLQAQQEQAYAEATKAFQQGDYSQALSQCQQFHGTERFDRLGTQIGQEQTQLQKLQQALQQGRYDAILTGAWPAKPAFEKVKTAATEENRVLDEARRKLTKGDYNFVQSLENADYRTKSVFAAVLEAGKTESQALGTLRRSQEAGDRASVRDGLAKLAPDLRGKDPFVELDKWAAQPVQNPAVDASSPNPEPQGANQIAHLETVLRKLEIRFGTKDPDPAVIEDGRPVAHETNISKAKRAEAYARVRYLIDYRNDGWLTDERKARLQKLEQAIRNSKE
jgi:hypothetical protein